MSKLFTIYYKTSLRNEIIENEFSVTVDLSPADCELMVRNKGCNNFDMIYSDTTSCSYEGVRVHNYVFLNNGTLFKQTGACELRLLIFNDYSRLLV